MTNGDVGVHAVILAAGEGTRLRPHTADRPKCLVPLAGRPLLEWQLASLRAAGIADISIVTGYRAERLAPYGLPQYPNPHFDSTNMVASLMCAADVLRAGTRVLVAYGDLVYEPRVVTELLACDAPRAITVDRNWRALWSLRLDDPLADAETLKLDPSGDVRELGRTPRSYDEIEGQYMGLLAFDAASAAELVEVYAALPAESRFDGRPPEQMFMTSFVQHLVDTGRPVRAVPVEGGWLEIDTVDDLATYEALHARGELDAFCRLPAD